MMKAPHGHTSFAGRSNRRQQEEGLNPLDLEARADPAGRSPQVLSPGQKDIRRILSSRCGSPWKAALIWRVDEHSNSLRQACCWHGSSDASARFGAISERQAYSRGIGFCGEIWQSECMGWIPNIIEDARFIRSQPATEAGLHTAAAAPLWHRGQVIGVLELFSDRIMEADDTQLAALARLGRRIAPRVAAMRPRRPGENEVPPASRGLGRPVRSREAETLQAIYRRLAEVQENERHRLASQLHDQVGQSLTALNINLSLMKRRLPADAANAIAPLLDDCIGLAENVFVNIRDVMMELYPAVLKSDGLISALRWSAEQFQRRCGVSMTLSGDDPHPRLPLTVEITLFRVAQECLSNLAKHARATRAVISLEAGPRSVRLSTRDDGQGFDACVVPAMGQEHGWGMQIMRERLAAIGGTLHIESAPMRGTRIIAEVPR